MSNVGGIEPLVQYPQLYRQLIVSAPRTKASGTTRMPNATPQSKTSPTNRSVLEPSTIIENPTMPVVGGRGQAWNVERAMGILERYADVIERINSHVFPVSEAQAAIERQRPGERYDQEIVHAPLVPDE